MSIFADLQFEDVVQLDDRVRLTAWKSFVSKGSAAITVVQIKPTRAGSFQSVFESDSDNWYLDWRYSDNDMDIDTDNNLLDFKENSTEFQATIATGTYDSSALATAIKTALDTAGANTYTVIYDSSLDKYTISADANFDMLPRESNLWSILGFADRFEQRLLGSSSYTGNKIRETKKKVTVSVDNGTTPVEFVKYIGVISKERDHLFSDDTDLTAYEPNIKRWVAEYRDTFLDVHREAQREIIAWLDEEGYVNVYSDKFIIDDLMSKSEFKEWSKFMVLRLIFEGRSNAIDDIFAEKSKKYGSLELSARNRAVMRVDINRDGLIDSFEQINSVSGRVFVR